MTRSELREVFLECMERFVDMSYRPPGTDKLRDAETHAGFRACLDDQEWCEDFIGRDDPDANVMVK